MNEKYLLGIDFGTTALKAVVFDRQGRQISEAGIEYSLESPEPDFVEVEPDVYWNSLKEALKIIAETCDLKAIRSISFSCQGETMLFMGRVRLLSGWTTGARTRQNFCRIVLEMKLATKCAGR